MQNHKKVNQIWIGTDPGTAIKTADFFLKGLGQDSVSQARKLISSAIVLKKKSVEEM